MPSHTYKHKAFSGEVCHLCGKQFREGETIRKHYNTFNLSGSLMCWNGEACARRERESETQGEILDANGNPIHIGDTVQNVKSKRTMGVLAITPDGKLHLRKHGWRFPRANPRNWRVIEIKPLC